MSIRPVVLCDFCPATAEVAPSGPPQGWATLAIEAPLGPVVELHACPYCQIPEQAATLWLVLDRKKLEMVRGEPGPVDGPTSPAPGAL